MAPIRTAIYCRVSTPKQSVSKDAGKAKDGKAQQETSLETQEASCRKYAADNDLTISEAHVYNEVGSRLEMWERPMLTKFREAIKRGEIDAFIIHARDRLSGVNAHRTIILEEARHFGVKRHCVTEPFGEEDDKEEALMENVRAYASEVEVEKIRERTARGHMARLDAGKIASTRRLYGYIYNDDRSGYLIDPVTSLIVRRIFDEYLIGGSSLRAIAAGLTADGIPGPQGGFGWVQTQVGRVIGDVQYTGISLANRTKSIPPGKRTRKYERIKLDPSEWKILEGVVPPLITRAEWEAGQARLVRNKEQSARRTSDPEQWLLRGGFAVCGDCAAWMSPRNGTNHIQGEKYQYQCARAFRATSSHIRHTIGQPILDQAVWDYVSALVSDPAIIRRELDRMTREEPGTDDLDSVDRILTDIAKKRTRLAKSLAMLDEDGAEPVVRELNALGAQSKAMQRERETILARRQGWAAAQATLASLEAWCGQIAHKLDTLSYAERRLLFEALGVRVKVNPSQWKGERWIITTAIPLSAQTAHSETPITPGVSQNSLRSRLADTSAALLVLRWSDQDAKRGIRQPAAAF